MGETYCIFDYLFILYALFTNVGICYYKSEDDMNSNQERIHMFHARQTMVMDGDEDQYLIIFSSKIDDEIYSLMLYEKVYPQLKEWYENA